MVTGLEKSPSRPRRPYPGGSTSDGTDNAAIWVTAVSPQPGFLFPFAPPTTTAPPTPGGRRQITEEASVELLPQQVHLFC